MSNSLHKIRYSMKLWLTNTLNPEKPWNTNREAFQIRLEVQLVSTNLNNDKNIGSGHFVLYVRFYNAYLGFSSLTQCEVTKFQVKKDVHTWMRFYFCMPFIVVQFLGDCPRICMPEKFGITVKINDVITFT